MGNSRNNARYAGHVADDFYRAPASGGDMTLLRIGIDGISRATPLDTFKTSL